MSYLKDLSPTTRTVLRVIVGLVGAVASGYASAGLFFVGLITYSGGLFGSTNPDVGLGALILGSAVAAATTAITLLVWAMTGWNKRRLARIALVTAALGYGAIITATVS